MEQGRLRIIPEGCRYGKKENSMPMNPCSNCLELQWAFSFDDATGIVTATCKYCESVISFESKRARKMKNPQSRQKPNDIPTNAYLHQDPGTDDTAPW
jgi:hypothetical protein